MTGFAVIDLEATGFAYHRTDRVCDVRLLGLVGVVESPYSVRTPIYGRRRWHEPSSGVRRPWLQKERCAVSADTARTKKDQRFEFRVSAADRELFARAADALGTPVSAFANEQLRIAAQKVLADRTEFVLSPVEAALWDAMCERPARDLPDVRALLAEPSIFVNE
jgi:uncharacterized protein (DUF1778 family)